MQIKQLSIFAVAAAALSSNVACAATSNTAAKTPAAKASTNASANASAPKTTASTDAAQSEIVNRVRIFPRAGFASRMIGGEIQGSNESPTNGFTTLAKIKNAPKEGVWTALSFKNTKRYRFVRYFAPNGSYANVAELQFFNSSKGSSTRIKGVQYGTFGSRDSNGNVFDKAFDGDVKTFFDAFAPNSQYLGIEIKSATDGQTPDAPVVVGNGLRHYHIGNSLTDGMGDYVREIALAAGYKDDWVDRQTIPGSPLWMNYQSEGGFGTPYRKAFVDFAPISDLVMQTFISNGDTEDPEFSLKFYNDARVKSPKIRPWIYGQWESTRDDERVAGSTSWQERNLALMRIYIAHALNFNAQTKDKRTRVIPGGLALNNLKRAFDAKKVPGLNDFFVANFNDDLHLSEAGRQFIGMVIYSTLYDKSPVGLPVVKIGDNAPKLNDAQNRVYQQVAWDTVQSFKKDSGASLGFMVPNEIDARTFIGFSSPIRGSRVGNIDENRSFTYVLNAPKAGKYTFAVSATTDKTDKNLDIFVNNKAAGSVIINPNKDQPAADSTTTAIDLKAGLNLLRVLVPFNRTYDLNSIKISPVGQPLKNTMPIFDMSGWEDDIKSGDKLVRDFRVFDAETPVAQLKVTATSDNANLVPASALKVESGEFKGEWGNVYSRRLTVTPTKGKTGEANVLVTVSDAEGVKRVQSFKVKVK